MQAIKLRMPAHTSSSKQLVCSNTTPPLHCSLATKASRITVVESPAYCDQVHDELYLVIFVVSVGSGGGRWADMGTIALHSRSCFCTSVWVCEYVFKNWIPDSLTCHQILVHKGNCFHKIGPSFVMCLSITNTLWETYTQGVGPRFF